jgi:hypothetical protein
VSQRNTWGDDYNLWYEAAEELLFSIQMLIPDGQKKILLTYMEDPNQTLSFIARIEALKAGFIYRTQ